jgi:hypothetical protein
MVRHARTIVLVLSGPDVRVRRDYLSAVGSPPLADPRWGHECLYSAVGGVGFAAMMEALLINTGFIRWRDLRARPLGAAFGAPPSR